MMKQQAASPNTGYRNDDINPYVLKTTDYGNTWVDISSNLPDYPVNVIFEDARNPDLLTLAFYP
ncbi:MAG TPA: hypothetical protein ENH59_09200 [Bacteroidetes bacterium]|nr:hypothetical protein [Bacteroidota bacterium]